MDLNAKIGIGILLSILLSSCKLGLIAHPNSDPGTNGDSGSGPTNGQGPTPRQVDSALVGKWEWTGQPSGSSTANRIILILNADGSFDALEVTDCSGACAANATESRIDEQTGSFESIPFSEAGISVTQVSTPSPNSPVLGFQALYQCDSVPGLYRAYHDSSNDAQAPGFVPQGIYSVENSGSTLTITYAATTCSGGAQCADYPSYTRVFSRVDSPTVAPGACSAANPPIVYDSAEEKWASNTNGTYCVGLSDGTELCAPDPGSVQISGIATQSTCGGPAGNPNSCSTPIPVANAIIGAFTGGTCPVAQWGASSNHLMGSDVLDNWTQVGSASTDANGNFAMVVPEGTVFLAIQKTGSSGGISLTGYFGGNCFDVPTPNQIDVSYVIQAP